MTPRQAAHLADVRAGAAFRRHQRAQTLAMVRRYNLLTRLRDEGRSWGEISERFGITPDALRGRYSAMGRRVAALRVSIMDTSC